MKQPTTLLQAALNSGKPSVSSANKGSQDSLPSISNKQSEKNSILSLSQEAKYLSETYKDGEALLEAFNPSVLSAFCARYSDFCGSDDTLAAKGRIYALDAKMYRKYVRDATGTKQPAPTLATVSRVFAHGTAVSWIVIQLSSLAEFAGVKDKFTERQLNEQASLILSQFYFLRLSELMDFFRLFRLGKYGKFYGVADPMVITEALGKFLKYRADVIDELLAQQAREEAEREREEREREAVTYEQYRELLRKEGKTAENEELLRFMMS